ncbi:MAG: hypothetical protein J6Y18_01560 [Candidatus Methanomethylophilaceae archaeon]|nr:hypothetical protein [Candidatus Methanomethylophilaceae archaeon]
MRSGLRPRIMIACVTFETVKVSDPVDFYEANKVYLIHYTAKDHPIYGEFYDQTVKLIKEKRGDKIEIVSVEEKVWKFADMLRTVVGIIDRENISCDGKCDIYVNISAGSPEYSAASTIASMMYENTIPFAASTDDYMIESEEEIKNSYFGIYTDPDGKESYIPIGLSKSIKEPVRLQQLFIKKPDERLVRGLRIFKELSGDGPKPKRVTAPQMIERLEKAHLWNHEAKEGKNGGTSSNAVYYHREFIERWVKHKWIEKDDSAKRYILTEEGRWILNTFYQYEEEKDNND